PTRLGRARPDQPWAQSTANEAGESQTRPAMGPEHSQRGWGEPDQTSHGPRAQPTRLGRARPDQPWAQSTANEAGESQTRPAMGIQILY
ncbi:hypothetical protein P7K49_040155, partial [Saguinus oedipus]